jgi:hypothetical protein
MNSEGFHFIISYVIYPFDLLVSVCEPDEKITKTLTDRLPEDTHDEIEELLTESDARTVMFSSGQTAIRFSKSPECGVIAHEAFHAVKFLMDRISIPLSSVSDEAWAYLLQYIVHEISKRLHKTPKTPKTPK